MGRTLRTPFCCCLLLAAVGAGLREKFFEPDGELTVLSFVHRLLSERNTANDYAQEERIRSRRLALYSQCRNRSLST